MPSSKQLQKCEALIKKHKVEVIDLKAIDLTGRLHHISLPVYTDILKKLLSEGVGFDGSSYGFRKVENSDMILTPDLNTASIDPFREAPTLSFYTHILLADGARTPFTQDARMLAKKAELLLKKTTGADKSEISDQRITEGLSFLCRRLQESQDNLRVCDAERRE